MKNSHLRHFRIAFCFALLLSATLAWSAPALTPSSATPGDRLPDPTAQPLPPAAVGWSNLFVPGMGGILRGYPVRGLTEAGISIGTYYGGTYFSGEGAFSIDGSVLVPTGGSVTRPAIGQIMQEFGLKYHFYNTFYHYQQASLDPRNAELEKQYQQPLYLGDWKDTLLAPFRWKNLSTFWTYVPIGLAAGYLAYSYKHTSVVQQPGTSTGGQEAIYDFGQAISLPLGSSFGEEVLFRGFIMREIRYYTNSIPLAILGETALFTAIHPPELRPTAALGGVFFALCVNHFDGDLEQAIASHFWVDFLNGVVTSLLLRRIEGQSVPFHASLQIPF